METGRTKRRQAKTTIETPQMEPEKEDFDKDDDEENFQPTVENGEPILEVECGTNKAKMYLSKLAEGSKGPCVFFHGSWLTPNEFQYVSGRATAKDWKRSIRYNGKSLKLLFAKGILSLGATTKNGRISKRKTKKRSARKVKSGGGKQVNDQNRESDSEKCDTKNGSAVDQLDESSTENSTTSHESENEAIENEADNKADEVEEAVEAITESPIQATVPEETPETLVTDDNEVPTETAPENIAMSDEPPEVEVEKEGSTPENKEAASDFPDDDTEMASDEECNLGDVASGDTGTQGLFEEEIKEAEETVQNEDETPEEDSSFGGDNMADPNTLVEVKIEVSLDTQEAEPIPEQPFQEENVGHGVPSLSPNFPLCSDRSTWKKMDVNDNNEKEKSIQIPTAIVVQSDHGNGHDLKESHDYTLEMKVNGTKPVELSDNDVPSRENFSKVIPSGFTRDNTFEFTSEEEKMKSDYTVVRDNLVNVTKTISKEQSKYENKPNANLLPELPKAEKLQVPPEKTENKINEEQEAVRGPVESKFIKLEDNLTKKVDSEEKPILSHQEKPISSHQEKPITSLQPEFGLISRPPIETQHTSIYETLLGQKQNREVKATVAPAKVNDLRELQEKDMFSSKNCSDKIKEKTFSKSPILEKTLHSSPKSESRPVSSKRETPVLANSISSTDCSAFSVSNKANYLSKLLQELRESKQEQCSSSLPFSDAAARSSKFDKHQVKNKMNGLHHSHHTIKPTVKTDTHKLLGKPEKTYPKPSEIPNRSMKSSGENRVTSKMDYVSSGKDKRHNGLIENEASMASSKFRTQQPVSTKAENYSDYMRMLASTCVQPSIYLSQYAADRIFPFKSTDMFAHPGACPPHVLPFGMKFPPPKCMCCTPASTEARSSPISPPFYSHLQRPSQELPLPFFNPYFAFPPPFLPPPWTNNAGEKSSTQKRTLPKEGNILDLSPKKVKFSFNET